MCNLRAGRPFLSQWRGRMFLFRCGWRCGHSVHSLQETLFDFYCHMLGNMFTDCRFFARLAVPIQHLQLRSPQGFRLILQLPRLTVIVGPDNLTYRTNGDKGLHCHENSPCESRKNVTAQGVAQVLNQGILKRWKEFVRRVVHYMQDKLTRARAFGPGIVTVIYSRGFGDNGSPSIVEVSVHVWGEPDDIRWIVYMSTIVAHLIDRVPLRMFCWD